MTTTILTEDRQDPEEIPAPLPPDLNALAIETCEAFLWRTALPFDQFDQLIALRDSLLKNNVESTADALRFGIKRLIERNVEFERRTGMLDPVGAAMHVDLEDKPPPIVTSLGPPLLDADEWNAETAANPVVRDGVRVILNNRSQDESKQQATQQAISEALERFYADLDAQGILRAEAPMLDHEVYRQIDTSAGFRFADLSSRLGAIETSLATLVPRQASIETLLPMRALERRKARMAENYDARMLLYEVERLERETVEKAVDDRKPNPLRWITEKLKAAWTTFRRGRSHQNTETGSEGAEQIVEGSAGSAQ